ncbi:hypothetical protein QN362_05425 [Actimicrobium sp. CCC2.4]|uniref:hypothetical protein n=1 Tax=Actimicrobium sp. CCC2.4 TaxID=3048606 RepID=UPI002AC95A52|nr:hypothetical protein [Actimicrobium sp. CCC2.4]MEB0134767.1 hypothetical protein [Actimicrobium sp. CCC2.4]WPX30706.1 hypothetical protein RHM62_10510 [Actimicrobium sp. CCC2.4]
MVNLSFKSLRLVNWGAISSVFYLVIFFISLANAFVRNDSEPQLVLAFFGFPLTWLFYLIFHPFLEWVGPFGAVSRRIAEWLLLGMAGVIQYWLIGATAAYLIIGKHRRESEAERIESGD